MLTPGTKLGPFEIVAPLGAGGMGEVYLARDTRLGREVAIKALPPGFAQDPERLARFEREARLLASLSHPNVAGIHGLELVEGHRYLVLEFVEGETLADRLARGPLALADAIEITRQIAAGVEAAHDAGVVHRDLKPGNVMLKRDGSVKVLDFGLAKATSESAPGDSNLSASPTMTHGMTGAGMILGTAAYMSPEQARGRAVDRRTDIWSFGCVLFECLTGQQVFRGETVSDLIARILERDPDWQALPPATPRRIVHLLQRCLTKDARQRLQSIGEGRIVLEQGAAPDSARAAAPAEPVRDANGIWRAIAVGAALVAVAATILLLRPPPRAPLTRLSILSPDPGADIGGPCNYAISPDGRTLAFVMTDSTGTDQLWLRALERSTARRLEGTAGARLPMWSPDSRDLAYFSAGQLLRVPASGGVPQTICDVADSRGGAWGKAGIIFAAGPRSGLSIVDAAGGKSRPLTTLDAAAAIVSHRFPTFLPDGEHFIFVAERDALTDHDQAYLASVDDPRVHVLEGVGSGATFAAPDRVLWVRDRSIVSQRLDMRTFRLVGQATPLSDAIRVVGEITGMPAVRASRTGVLVYDLLDDGPVVLRWLDASGALAMAAPAVRGSYPPAVSPDGKHAVLSLAGDHGVDNFVADLESGRTTLLGTPGLGVTVAKWNAAGTRIAGVSAGQHFSVDQIDPRDGSDSLILAGDGRFQEFDNWSQDGRTMLLHSLRPGRGRVAEYLTLAPGGARRIVYSDTSASEVPAALSHDGRWLLYWGYLSGRPALYIDSFPVRTHARCVSNGIAFDNYSPAWSAQPTWWGEGDRQVYFVGGDAISVYRVDMDTADGRVSGTPQLFARLPAGNLGADLDLPRRRFLVLMPKRSPTHTLTVVQNWVQELETAK